MAGDSALHVLTTVPADHRYEIVNLGLGTAGNAGTFYLLIHPSGLGYFFVDQFPMAAGAFGSNHTYDLMDLEAGDQLVGLWLPSDGVGCSVYISLVNVSPV